MSTWGILVAAGSGSRFGAPKQFAQLGEKTILEWSFDALSQVVDEVIVVVPPGHRHPRENGDSGDQAVSELISWIPDQIGNDGVRCVEGGATRSDSVRAGLSEIPEDVDIVLIHDAARPFATPALGQAVKQAIIDGADAAIPGLPVADTLKRVDKNGTVLETVDRSALYTVQTPQAFRHSILRDAHRTQTNATDDAALVELIGGKVVIVPGEYLNTKITVLHDLDVANRVLQND